MSRFKTGSQDQAVVTEGRTLDYAAGVYDYLSPLMTFFQEGSFSKIAIDLLGINGGERILDVGCGTGTLTIEIFKRLSQQKGSLVVGLDAAPKMIERAKKKTRGFKNIYFDVGVAEQLPYKDEYFDLVISTFFFHHVNFQLKKRSLEEIRRVLKRAGVAVIVDVDVPTNIFGTFCAWCGYWLFQQEEIRENIEGRLRESIDSCEFRSWYQVSGHLGYISIFKLEK